MLDKTYRPDEVESLIYEAWEGSGAFGCDPEAEGEAFCIVIPPPNVTGSLHMGHAFNNTIQDILIRFERKRGRNVLWQPGTDHAGIATQSVVERQLAEEGIRPARGTLEPDIEKGLIGRDDFIERVWAWREESGGTILRQLRRLGASCDWSRERFTMDEGLSKAVVKVFVDLHKQGLIYRDKRLVNWDPKLHTAISDLEVESREVDGHLWHIRYPILGEEGRFITVATTRPETMLGDTAVAVHPDDARYADLVGKQAVLPLIGRHIPIVADDYADPEQGSGAVKITPAHDFNDFEVGRRHGLEMLNILDADACINNNAPDPYCGLDRYEARKKVVADLESQGLLEKIDAIRHTVPYGDRSGVPVEPWLTDQWFADAKTLAVKPIEAVEQGRVKFVPENWSNVFFEWMRNIQPWCISRQLWWGHRIPAWFGPDRHIFVEATAEEALAAAELHYGKPTELTRDPDVLDTWFSSALWPFSTLGWPDKTPHLDRYYPTGVLVTGFDIIFFWVARMMMFGEHFMGERPFETVYIHALVRDELGAKMSKSKGNVIDPLDLIDEYGADALRFTLTAQAAQGRDIKLSTKRVEGYRNFTTKLWNVSRFCEMNGATHDPAFDPASCKETVNRWIVSEVARLEARVREGIESYRFNETAGALYQFAWHAFCDWYVEFTKPILDGGDAAAAETKACLGWTLDQILNLLHPIMPFVTEELWGRLGGKRDTTLILAPWPVYDPGLIDAAAADEMNWVVELITQVRAVRSEMNVPAAAKIPMIVNGAGEAGKARLATHEDQIMRLARLSSLEVDGGVPAGSAQVVLGEATLVLPLGEVIDLDQERKRLEGEIAKLEGEIGKIDQKLANPKFIANAPDEIVEIQRERKADAQAACAKLDEALRRFGAA